MTTPDKPLLSHTQVGFEHPAQGPHHCSQCEHWLNPGCQIVEPPVTAGDWCIRWLRRKTTP